MSPSWSISYGFLAWETFGLITIGFFAKDGKAFFLGNILGIGFGAAFGFMIGLILISAFYDSVLEAAWSVLAFLSAAS